MDIGGSKGSSVWKKLWRLNVPAKIKIFGWHVLHGLIPFLGILANRHVGNTSQCPICSTECEDILDTLFSCAGAKQIWEKLGIWNIISDALNLDRSGSMIMEHLILNLGSWEPLGGIGLAEIILT